MITLRGVTCWGADLRLVSSSGPLDQGSRLEDPEMAYLPVLDFTDRPQHNLASSR